MHMYLSHAYTHFFLSWQVGLGVTETMGLVVIETDEGETVGLGVGEPVRLGIAGDVAAKELIWNGSQKSEECNRDLEFKNLIKSSAYRCENIRQHR